ncbi:MAG TPA: putative quinol monooxygenase [Deltaproteobacteria bacterium]|nr:putative quinol monooxygenase [Deltaproteobacteria bacterium]
MITVIATMRSRKGMEQEMLDAFRSMIPHVDKEEGTLEYVLHRARKDPALLVVYERYRDKDALSYHSASPHFAKLLEKIGPMLDGAPTIEILEPLAAIDRKDAS